MGERRSVVVTGAGAGIGRGIAERLAADGWTVVGVELDARAAEEVHTVLTAKGGGHIVVGDAASREVLAQAREEAARRAPLAGWVNNAAVVATDSVHIPEPDQIGRAHV